MKAQQSIYVCYTMDVTCHLQASYPDSLLLYASRLKRRRLQCGRLECLVDLLSLGRDLYFDAQLGLLAFH